MSFLENAVEAIRLHWPELSVLLDASARQEAAEILADAESDPAAAADDLRELVKPFTVPGHPARAALTPAGVRFDPGRQAAQDTAVLLGLLTRLRAMVGGPDGAEPAPPAAGAAASPGPYRPDSDDAWLLAEPALPADAVARRSPDLILLTDENEVERVPAFQLDPASGEPYAVVVEINRLLSADVDPWGAADWWLGPNVWLDAAPARLLGTGADHALLSAARAEIPEW